MYVYGGILEEQVEQDHNLCRMSNQMTSSEVKKILDIIWTKNTSLDEIWTEQMTSHVESFI